MNERQETLGPETLGPETLGQETLGILATGPGLTIQDHGRRGWMRFGVSISGSIDRESLDIGNALLGNAPGTAALEFALTGGRFIAETDMVGFAVTGGNFVMDLDGIPVPPYQTSLWRRGQILSIGGAHDAIYGYLALVNGVVGDCCFASSSMHIRSGLSAIPLQVGSRIALRAPAPVPARRLPGLFQRDRTAPIRIVAGPQEDYLDDASWRVLLDVPWRCGAMRDRMAMRLEGPVLVHKRGFNIVSDGVMPGAIQLPGDGFPTVLLADGAPTGGYPKIATVIGADLPRLAQCPIGESIRFTRIPVEEAEEAGIARREALTKILSSIIFHHDTTVPNHLLHGQNLISGVVSGEEE